MTSSTQLYTEMWSQKIVISHTCDLLCQMCVVSKSVNAGFFSAGITSSPGILRSQVYPWEVEGDHKQNPDFGL